MRLFRILMGEFFLAGALAFAGAGSAAAVELGSFSFQTVTDPQMGIPMIKLFAPAGWRLTVNSDWNRCSAASIGLGIVQLDAPDGSRIVITTSQRYDWSTSDMEQMVRRHPTMRRFYRGAMNNHTPGCDLPHRVFYLPYESLDAYARFFWDNSGYRLTDLRNADDGTLKASYVKRVTPYLQRRVQEETELTRKLSKVSVTGMFADMAVLRGYAARKDGSGTEVTEQMVNVYGYSTSVQLGEAKLDSMAWEPAVIAFFAPSMERFRANYQVFRSVVDNSRFMPQWSFVRDHLGQRMALAVLNGMNLAQQEILELQRQAWAEAQQKDLSSPSYSSSQVTEAISDTIYGRNDYTDGEGNHFKVDTGYSVYLDSDNNYHVVEENTQVPDSYQLVKPNTIGQY